MTGRELEILLSERDPHAAPEEPLTLDQAHAATRRHRDCLAERCPLKAAAMDVLTTAGHIKPADNYDKLR